MNARILCPGPSLAEYKPGDFDGLTLGVNRSATAFRCNVWACQDWPAIVANAGSVIGFPILLSSPDSILAAFKRIQWKGSVEPSCRFCPTAGPVFTFDVAARYAAYLGVTDIAVYGADWSGTLDWDGTAAGERRTDERWSQEAAAFGRLQDEMGTKQVKVYRVQNGNS